MLPMVCVELPAFPLQLLLKDHPAWGRGPAVVVEDDRAQGRVLCLNEAAFRRGVVVGMRHGAALSLCGDLNAGVVPPWRVDQEIRELVTGLQTLSPLVSPDPESPGVFFINGRGLERLFQGPAELGRRVREVVREGGFESRVVMGWTRFGTRAVACGDHRGKVVILLTPEIERATARRVPLARLPMAAGLRKSLSRLGISTLGAFVDLPADSLRARFGDRAWELHAQARGILPQVFEAFPLREPLESRLDLEWPEQEVSRVVDGVRGLLDPLLVRVRDEGALVREVRVLLALDDGRREELEVRPAEPSSEPGILLELVRLRLARMTLLSGVIEITLSLEAVRAVSRQANLFAERPRRDLAALARALARLRAELGEQAVVSAELKEAQLPEACFAWCPHGAPLVAEVRDASQRPLVRSIFARPLPMAGPSGNGRDDGWLPLGEEVGAVTEIRGPFLISGGWWRREVARAYHWIATTDGHRLWVYHDRRRLRWLAHGELI